MEQLRPSENALVYSKMVDWIGYRYIYPDSFSTSDQQIQYCESISAERLKICASKLFVRENMHVAVSCLKKDRNLIRQEVKTGIAACRKG